MFVHPSLLGPTSTFFVVSCSGGGPTCSRPLRSASSRASSTRLLSARSPPATVSESCAAAGGRRACIGTDAHTSHRRHPQHQRLRWGEGAGVLLPCAVVNLGPVLVPSSRWSSGSHRAGPRRLVAQVVTASLTPTSHTRKMSAALQKTEAYRAGGASFSRRRVNLPTRAWPRLGSDRIFARGLHPARSPATTRPGRHWSIRESA